MENFGRAGTRSLCRGHLRPSAGRARPRFGAAPRCTEHVAVAAGAPCIPGVPCRHVPGSPCQSLPRGTRGVGRPIWPTTPGTYLEGGGAFLDLPCFLEVNLIKVPPHPFSL